MMLSYYAYKIPFKKPFQISNHILKQRNGILLVYNDGEHQAYGEVAPLPGFSKESIEEVLSVLLENQKNLEFAFSNNNADQLISILDNIHNFPSLSFGLDTLMLDLKSRKDDKLISELLFTAFQPPSVNGAISIQNVSESLQQAKALLADGVNTLKIKVGINHKQEKRVIAALRENHPAVKIRIDANQAWDIPNAIQNLKDLAEFEIEYCEQPVSEHDIHALRKVREAVPIPIAADEAVRSFQKAKELIDAKACDVLILKPSLFGRIKNCISTKQWVHSNGVEVVLTTTFDTIVGRTMTAILASGLGSKKYAHGLDTGRFLNEPYYSQNEIEKAFFLLPTQPGVLKNIDLSYLKKIS